MQEAEQVRCPFNQQSHLLAGWQKADEDIKAGEADPAMSNKVITDDESEGEDSDSTAE
jgi:hypothetical protein